MSRPGWRLAALCLVALLLRLQAAASAAVIERDGIGYLDNAALLWRGELGRALARPAALGYPALLALTARLLEPLRGPAPPDETLAVAVTALAASLTTLLLGLVAWRWAGARAGLWTALLAATLPQAVELGGEILSDAPFFSLLALVLWLGERTLSARRGWPWALPLGTAAAAAYFVRPEGLVLLPGLSVALLVAKRAGPGQDVSDGPARRLTDLAALWAPAAAVIVPYLVFIRGLPALGGQGAGAWKLTTKRHLGERLAQLTPGLLAERAGLLTLFVGRSLGPAWLGLLGLRRPPDWTPDRAPADWRARALALSLGLGLPLGAAYLAIRVDTRYGGQLAVLALPWLGIGLARLAGGKGRRSLTLLLALALALIGAVTALRPRRTDKASYRQAAAVLTSWGSERVLAHDSRAAYYAQATPLHLVPHFLAHPQQRLDPLIWQTLARDWEADAVIVRGRAEAALVEPLRQAYGPPEVVIVPGGEELVLFRLGSGRR